MKPENDKKLVEAFPNLYADRYADMRQTAMCWGFPGDGWFQIIWDLSEKLEPIASKKSKNCRKCSLTKEKHPTNICSEFDAEHLRAVQVKEKFGILRFYTNYSILEADEAIHEAEKLSTKTCEQCGQSGKTVSFHGWHVTLCPGCVELEKKLKTLDEEEEG